MAVDPARIFQKNWPRFYENGMAKQADYVVVSRGEFDPTSETQTETETYRKTIYPVFDGIKERFADNDPVGQSRGGGLSLNGIKVLFPSLDIDIRPAEGHFIVEEETGNRWRIVGPSEDPVPAVYELEVVKIG